MIMVPDVSFDQLNTQEEEEEEQEEEEEEKKKKKKKKEETQHNTQHSIEGREIDDDIIFHPLFL